MAATFGNMKAVLIEAAARRLITEDGTRSKVEGQIFKPFMEQMASVAAQRQAFMHDRDEAFVLSAALDSITKGDAPHAAELIRDRLQHLDRRMKNQLDEEESAKAAKDCHKVASNCATTESGDAHKLEMPPDESLSESDPLLSMLQSACARNEIQSAQYWRDAVEGGLRVMEAGMECIEADPDVCCGLRDHLAAHGWVQSAIPCVGGTNAILNGMRSIAKLGWPPAFVFMYDETWSLAKRVWKMAETIIGAPCVMEPSFAAFNLRHHSSTGRRHIGANFGQPHRDHSYSESCLSDGSPKILSVWIPLNNVDCTNGCMYVVPKDFDNKFDRDDLDGHVHLQRKEADPEDTENSSWNFPLQGIRPLEGAAGSFMAWQGNLIHWGSSCHPAALDPRANLAFVFRRADVPQDPKHPPMAADELDGDGPSVGCRLGMVAQALLWFSNWYDLKPGVAALLKTLMNSASVC